MSGADDLAALLSSGHGADETAAIVDLLGGVSRADLNEMLGRVSGPDLFRSLPAHRRDEVIDLLGRHRRDELAVESLARVVHGLQSMRRSAHRDRVLAEILLSHRSTALTRLKNLINTAENHRDLEDLVFADLHEADRRTVLAHLAAEAPDLGAPDVKVLAGIDDTVFCKLHDRRWPRGMIYPGVLALLEALDLGPLEAPFDRGDLTFVTARPADAWALVDNFSRAALHRAGVSRLSGLSGSLRPLVSKEAMAARKLDNVDHYRRLFPEYPLVVVGDSGQEDVLVSERLMERDAAAVRLVLLHDVVDTPSEVRAAYAKRRIFFQSTWIGAAATAYAHGLISQPSLRRVANEAVGGFERTRWDSVDQRDRMREWFESDLARVDRLVDNPPES